MRDPRNTPVCVTNLLPEIASFTVEVLGFEDTGATWTFPVWQAQKFFCKPDAQTLPTTTQATLETATARLNRTVHIPRDDAARVTTNSRLSALTKNAADFLAKYSRDTDLAIPFANWCAAHNIADIDARVASAYVSNPHAGECVKAHRMALAPLGLATYEGKRLRDQTELSGPNAMSTRQTHILARLAFLRAHFARLAQSHVPLYRVVYSEAPLTPPRQSGFTSATFDRAVALRFLDAAQDKPYKTLYWQQVPVARLFMTHLETPQMRAPYAESEALLLAPPQDALF